MVSEKWREKGGTKRKLNKKEQKTHTQRRIETRRQKAENGVCVFSHKDRAIDIMYENKRLPII